MQKTSVNLDINGKTIILQTGQLAGQATTSVLARLGDTMVLVTVVEGKETELGYFPLTVEYVERLYAGGRIKGSRWVKREGRPSDEAILTARLIDRSIRPLFPKEYKKEIQVVVTVLSVDGENEPDVLSIVAVSAALSLSKIPWKGPVGAVRIGLIKEQGNGKYDFIINPHIAEIALSDLNLVVTQTKEKTLMLEADARQVSEDVVVEAIQKAYEENIKIIEAIEKLAKEIGQKKEVAAESSVLHELVARIEKSYKSEIIELGKSRATKEADSSESEDLLSKIFEEVHSASSGLANPESPVDKKTIAKAVEMILFEGIREAVLTKSQRVDGRKIDEIRPITVEVGLLPRTHGSALFQRGNTQSLTVVTLGSPRLEQLIESAEGEESKRYIHHYSMPPYSVGETGRMGTPSRREIGHGALAERALEAVIPSQEKFPYTIRVVSEILSSNGSTSMAATCGSTLALMDAGVPIKKPVAGIAMGMMSRLADSGKDEYVILSDIIGLEDFSGDMDFKVSGTDSGITAVQLDVKILGLTIDQIKETLQRAKAGRLSILEKMKLVITASRAAVSEFAPKIEVVKIPIEKIGEVIGPGGRVIRNIIAETSATVDVEDDGSVTVSGTSEEAVRKATDWVRNLTREIVVGEEFEGVVRRMLPFGAFVEILPGKEGMVHVSQMSTNFVKDPSDVVSIGQTVKVRVAEIDEQGRINLSMLFGPEAESRGRGTFGSEPGGRRLDRRGQTSGRRPERRDERPERRSPHPLSRQFQRERSERNNLRSTSPRPRFRKTHY